MNQAVKIEQLIFNIINTIQNSKKKLCLDKEFSDLSNQEKRVLLTIYMSQRNNIKLSAKDLAKTFGISIAAIMHKLDSLEDKKYICKESDSLDKRVKYIKLLPEAFSKCNGLNEQKKQNFEIIAKALGQEDVDNFIRILEKISHCVKGENND